MHFSIPDTQEIQENSQCFTGYNIHINGAFHCTVRYRQLYSLYEQIKKEYSTIAAQLPRFPSKKILPLSSMQLEERRLYLEKYIQAVGQEPTLSCSELFNGFLLNAQQETSGQHTENGHIDIFLMNGYKISLEIRTNERSDQVLEKVCDKINLPQQYVYYFSLFLIKTEEDGGITIVRKLQDFESPFISQKNVNGTHRIVLRKSYWDSAYDLELMTDKVALGLLYIQTVSDIEQGWVLCTKETRHTLATLQSQGNKKEYMNIARTLKYYGFIQFRPCVCDYPYSGSKVLVSAGNKELNLRVRLMGGDDVRQGSFKVTRMKCWRITTLHSEESKESSSNLELSFEYLISRDKLQWITIASEQAILMSMCLQSMVDELLLKKSGLRRKISNNAKMSSWNYLKRDGSSQIILMENKNIDSNHEIKEDEDTESDYTTTTPSTSSSSIKVVAGKRQSLNLSKDVVQNHCFDNDGIGDDDL